MTIPEIEQWTYRKGAVPDWCEQYTVWPEGDGGCVAVVFGDASIAQRIAATNDLLASLRFLVDAARTEPGMDIYRAHIRQAENAIAKATDPGWQ